jgi:THO complex subunit 2
MRQLKEGNVMELGILRTLLKTAGGYGFADFSPAASLSATQLEGRAGSITLKQETMSFGIVEEVNYRASNKIRRVMQTDGFGVSMLMLISQVRSRILFETRGKPMPLKLMGNLYDSCQVVMSILLEFLTDVSDEEGNESDIARRAITQYAEYLPSLEELVSTYGFDVVSAWMLCRPLIRAAASSNRYEGNKVKTFALTKETRQAYQAMLQGGDESPKPTSYLFEFFYMNSLYDIFCPEELYATESSRVTKEIERLQQRKTTAPPASVQPGPISQKSDRDEVKRLEAVSRILASDSSKQKDHVSNTMQNMEAIRDDFFASDNVSKASANALLTHCVFPRCTQSPEDAIYCARFVFALHNLEAKGFSTLHYIDELIRVVSGALFGLTEGEAAHLAILLVETWKVVNKWRYDEEAFEKEVAGKPGGFMEDRSEEGEGSATAITYKDFEGHYNSWHSSLGASLIGCLKSKEYIHTRTGLLVLTRIVDVFPTRPKVAYKLQDALAPLQDEASARPDIRASASSYGMMLLRARDEGKWVEEDASVVKAREEKEKQVAEERKKKLAEQFQEMERETEKITQEIGPRDSHRNDRRRGRDSRGPPQNGHDEPRFRPPPPEMRATESGEVMGRDRRDRMDRRGSPLRDADRGRRDRAPARGSDRHDGGGGGGGGRRRDGPEDGGERWARGEPQGGGDSRGRGTKRSRPSTPDDRGEDAGRDMDRKRARVAQSSGGRDYDSRRDAGRGNSPGRRRSPPRTPPQSRPSGGRSTRRGRR